MTKTYIISEETRKRCKIVRYDEKAAKQVQPLNLEMFHLFYDAQGIDFSIYFRTGGELVEFIKPKELSRELLDKLWAATQKDYVELEVCVLKTDYQRVQNLVQSQRTKKISDLKAKLPGLDDKVLMTFENLSEASQMVVRGGINAEVVKKVKASAAFLMANIMDSESAMSTLSRMILCDPTLYDHSASVAMIGAVIARYVLTKPLSEKDATSVAECGLYHDVGKTCVPSAILHKPGKLSFEEFEVMKTHTTHGFDELISSIQKGAHIDEIATRVVLEHHEKMDGTGYPFGKRGKLEENKDNGIHLFTRIVTIADVYSALLMKRVYKEAYTSERALEIMMSMAQGHFDLDIFMLFHREVCKSHQYTYEQVKKDRGRILVVDEKNQLSTLIRKSS